MLAGLLYAGSGVGLAAALLVRRARGEPIVLPDRGDLRWLAGAIGFGGVAGPILLLSGLKVTNAAPAALLLNLEGAFTALLACLRFGNTSIAALPSGWG